MKGQGAEKCKAGRPDSVYSEPWMGPFVVDALRTADLPGAMARAGIGWSDYLYARRSDPAFEAASQEVDLIIRHAMILRLECAAASGDRAAIKLLAGGLDKIRAQLGQLGAAEDPPEPRKRPGPEQVRQSEGPCRDCNGGLHVVCPHCDCALRVFHRETDQFDLRRWDACSPAIRAVSPKPGSEPVGRWSPAISGYRLQAAQAAWERQQQYRCKGLGIPFVRPETLAYQVGEATPHGYELGKDHEGRTCFRRVGPADSMPAPTDRPAPGRHQEPYLPFNPGEHPPEGYVVCVDRGGKAIFRHRNAPIQRSGG